MPGVMPSLRAAAMQFGLAIVPSGLKSLRMTPRVRFVENGATTGKDARHPSFRPLFYTGLDEAHRSGCGPADGSVIFFQSVRCRKAMGNRPDHDRGKEIPHSGFILPGEYSGDSG